MGQNRINNKLELINHLQSSISSTYHQLSEGRLEYDNYLLKTYIIEQDIPKDGDPVWYLENHFKIKLDKQFIQPKVRRTEDEDLLHVSFNEKMDIYVDTSNSRLWNFYSLSEASRVGNAIEQLILSPFFDKVWFYHNFMNDLQDWGLLRGFGLDYDKSKFDSDEETSIILKLQISGMHFSKLIYNHLNNIEELKSHITLSKIKLKNYDKINHTMFILEDIKYFGKITARGTDIGQHFETLTKLKEKYLSILSDIESRYKINWVERDDTIILEGYPIYFINKGEAIDKIEFIKRVFNGSKPFKLLGIATSIAGGYVVDVIDLHIGTTFTIQIYDQEIILYLKDDVCGNTILRFYSNLQHYYSNSFIVINDNNELII